MKLSIVPVAVALLASSVDAIGHNKPPPPKDIKPTLVEGFAWKDPFPRAQESFEPSCEAVKHFYAKEFTLNELNEPAPKGLWPWAKGLKKFFRKKEYPGGWSGFDRHGLDRAILQMNYTDVPLELRKWIEEQVREEGEFKDIFGVFEKPKDEKHRIEDVVEVQGEVDRSEDENKVMMFAPGALYHVLPLWVAETSDCKEQLLDLSNYTPEPASGKVIGWANHKKPKEQQTEFKVTVQELKDKVATSSNEGVKEDGSKGEL